MADELDLASEREEIARAHSIRACSRDLPPAVEAECSECGELAMTRGGVCTPCRAAKERRR